MEGNVLKDLMNDLTRVIAGTARDAGLDFLDILKKMLEDNSVEGFPRILLNVAKRAGNNAMGRCE